MGGEGGRSLQQPCPGRHLWPGVDLGGSQTRPFGRIASLLGSKRSQGQIPRSGSFQYQVRLREALRPDFAATAAR